MEVSKYYASRKPFKDETMWMIVLQCKNEMSVDCCARIFDGVSNMFIGTKEWRYSCDDRRQVTISVSYKNDIGQLLKALADYEVI